MVDEKLNKLIKAGMSEAEAKEFLYGKEVQPSFMDKVMSLGTIKLIFATFCSYFYFNVFTPLNRTISLIIGLVFFVAVIYAPPLKKFKEFLYRDVKDNGK